ncbi:adenylyl-sulfate kinase [Streptococcus suis]|nr:adenylyl-sulfate kinase [Streptococcus suis]MCH4696935.1 adenylyl-sulfate kinase [Streptococcus suis]MCP8379814.1 adenylyl-sulfate kinase [Streptococcus suis]MCP8647453.1 adenylyl-sulfate kinase [Streptococcus suis]
MIIWLNGPFGIGKTTLANILHKRIENSYLYDPELLGDFLQHQLPKTVCPEDFQDYSVWRRSTQQLIQDKIPLEQYILSADKTTILERLDNRVNEDNIWAKRHLDVCLYSMKIKIRLGDVDADRTEVHQIKSTTSDFDFRRV